MDRGSTVASQALSIPELLYTVLLFSDRDDNAANLVVCKRWAEEVIKVEWESMYNQLPLLRLLAPIEEVKKLGYVFTRAPSHDDWAVFNRYAARVKSLTWYADEWTSLKEILNVLGSRRKLFPNLKHLEAPCDTDTLRLLVHPHLTSLKLRPSPEGFINDEDPHQLSSTLTHLLDDEIRPLHLRRFAFDGIYLETSSLFPIVEPALINFLHPLKDHLVSLTLRPIWLNINVTHTIAPFPHLVKLISTDANDVISADPLTFSDALDSKSFSALQHLALMIRFDRAISCLSSGIQSLSRLTTLALVSDCTEQPAMFTRLLSLIVQVSPLLTDLEVESSDRDGPLPREHEHVLTFEGLKPVLQLEDLERLSIAYPTPLQLNYEDLKTIAETFEYLSILVLNPEPSVQTPTTLHMSALSALSFSPNPYNLEEISAYVDTSPDKFPEADERLILKGLQRLSFGRSPITKKAVIPSSVYLSRVLPEWFSVPGSLGGNVHVDGQYALWQEVVSLLPVLMDTLQTGQERALLSQQGLFSMA
ncbi:hypothetical protein ONZ45_g8221 [Pleurotus djamor]|nr:hypothetical protein ONZ45_g8221 [Pleurotus djamor]